MDAEVSSRIATVGHDRTSGASELMTDALGIVRLAGERGADAAEEAAHALCEAQPSMASFRNLAAAAAAEHREHGAIARFEQRWRRAPAALAREARRALAPEAGVPLRFVTCSFSGSVLASLRAIALTNAVHVTCGEGRPLLEGRRLAEALAASGVRVELRTDAALAGALPGCDGVLAGADAVTPAWFLNKCGTLALAASASLVGAGVYVLATRDKVVGLEVGELLRVREHDAAEVWEGAPAGITIANPYFERIPLALVTAIITDGGLRVVSG